MLHGLTPVKMRLMFEALGPTFVKVGQILSMRSEILPQSFCDELAKLRADADPMPYSTVLDVLAAEYGRPADEVFAHIDPKPLGSASLAQVHRATLKTGEDVAIKVQRPGVRETMAQDVSIMRSIAKAATKVIRTSQIVDLKGVVEELWDTFESETDFLIEPAISPNSSVSPPDSNTWTARRRTPNCAPSMWWSWSTSTASPSPTRPARRCWL